MAEAKRFINNWDYYYFGAAPKHLSSLTLNKTWMLLTYAWQTEQLTATRNPSDAVETQVTWTSSDTSIATVSDTWLVTCVTPWQCTITAACWWKSASCGVYNATPSLCIYLVGWGWRWWTWMCYQCRTWGWGWAWWVWEVNNVTFVKWNYTVTVWAWGYKCDYSVDDGCGNWCPSCITWTWVNYCVCGWGRWWWAVCYNNWSVWMQSTWIAWWSGWWWWFCNFAWWSHVWCWLGNCWWHWQCTCSWAPRYAWWGWGAWYAWADAYWSNWCWYWGIWVCTTFFGAAKYIAWWGNGWWDVYAPANCKRDGSWTLISTTYWGWRWWARYCKWEAATCYWWGGWGWGNCSNVNAWWAWYQWIVGVRYPLSCGYWNFITWGTKYQCTIWWVTYCIHCFTSSWTLKVG